MSGLGKLDSFPRTKLARTPTPLEEMPALTKELAGPSLYVKRDDMTGLAFGGNKARQLEFYFGAAQAEGADVALITGAVQSNFVRSAAAAAAKLGMDCHVQLEERVPDPDSTHRNSGNVLLNKLLGATIYSYDEGEDEAGADRRINEIAAELKTQGRTPYIIPLLPGHPPWARWVMWSLHKKFFSTLSSRILKLMKLSLPRVAPQRRPACCLGCAPWVRISRCWAFVCAVPVNFKLLAYLIVAKISRNCSKPICRSKLMMW